jgi:hypothetical protein
MDKPFRPTLRTQSDLEAAWTELMGPWGFSRQSVWMILIEDDELIPQIIEITDMEEPPEPDMIASFAEFLAHLAADGRRFAFLRSRPGHGGLTADDRAWARALYDAGRQAGVPVEVVHRASDQDLVAIPMDDALDAA